QARVELETALRTTAANNRELEEFAFVASHDLQEPLRKVRAFGDRLRTHAGDTLDAQAVDYIERMRAAAERMQRLIDDLLAYSRVSTSSRRVSRVDLDQVLREVLVDLDARVAESGATVAFDTLPPIEADATQMRQLLQNLIANALKFRDPARAVRVEVRARSIAQPGSTIADWLRIEIEDNGIGFDNRYGERIFAPFQRLHGRNEYEGSGIGLAIVRRIVERHGGLLAAHGQPGLGARFTIEMPMRQTQPRTSNPATEGRHA
ncbi:MAG TPA: ATP-binding protein, partial [Tahibacter sp.]|nr:ATP-binding protein [Tahibacter sp.]